MGLYQFKLRCIIANLREDDIRLLLYSLIFYIYTLGAVTGTSRMQPHNFKSLTAILITGFALGEFVKSGPRKKLKRRGATLITGATLNTGFTVAGL